MLPKMPKFANEAEEADWWYEQRHHIAAEFERVKPKLGPSQHVRRMAALRGITVDEMQAQMRANGTGVAAAEAVSVPKLPRSA